MRTFSLLLMLCICVSLPAVAAPLDGVSQIVLVLGNGWDDLHATLQRFDRTPSGWRAAGSAVPAALGRKGLGWGRGEVATAHEAGPVKHEGDGRSPAGIFRITGTFGFAAPAQAGTRMPYLQLGDSCECVDDVRSTHYNEVVDSVQTPSDWDSSEHMRRVPVYRWGAFVGHNLPPSEPGAGSCIFLHLWRGPDAGTAGCTAIAQAPMRALLKWLRPEKRPQMVALPRAVYARLRAAWNLP